MGAGKVILTLVKGVEGRSVYLNDCRICGPKPWGGGKVEKEWSVDVEDVRKALATSLEVEGPTC